MAKKTNLLDENVTKSLDEQVASGNFRKVYLLYGTEQYLIRTYKKKLRDAMVGDDDMNLLVVEGKDFDFPTIRETADTMPFFADRRLILMDGSGLFKPSKKKATEAETSEEEETGTGGAAGKNDKDQWIALLENLSETTVILFVETEVDARSKLFKWIQKNGCAAEFAQPSNDMLLRWAAHGFAGYQLKITQDALTLFVERCSDSMERMRSEISKLADYCMQRGEITVDDVRAVTSAHIENRIFEMIENVAAGREQKALEQYYDLVALHEEPMKIHALIARHFNQLLMIRTMMQERMNRNDIASVLGLNPYVVKILMDQAGTFSEEQLRDYLTLCVESDEAIKTGNLNATLSVELLILTMSRRKKTH